MSTPEVNGFQFHYEPTPPPSPSRLTPPASPAIRLNCSQEALAAPPPTLAGLRRSQELRKSPLRISTESLFPMVVPEEGPRKSPLRISTDSLFPTIVPEVDPYKERFKKIGQQASLRKPPESDCPESTSATAKLRNRYPDTYPKALDLVKLDHSDHYINANYFGSFILTQGPFINAEVDTVADFWLMAFEKATSIVCATNQMGYNRTQEYVEKCHPYWKSDYENDQLKVTLLEGPETVIEANEQGQKVTKRLFSIALGEEVRKVTHWHCENWNDNEGYDPKILAQFIKIQLAMAGHCIVNCSAGIGRSGAYAVAAKAIQEYLATKIVPSDERIDQLVIELRQRRPMSVQNKDQLKLISETVREFIRS